METLLPILARWAHILAAITAVGGVLFLRFILIPAVAKSLSDEEHARLRAPVMARWKTVVHVCITLLVLSGTYNAVRSFSEGPPTLYHALFGVKILAALAVFFISSCLVGRAAAFEGMRKKAPRWLAINAGLALTVVLLSGILKNLK